MKLDAQCSMSIRRGLRFYLREQSDGEGLVTGGGNGVAKSRKLGDFEECNGFAYTTKVLIGKELSPAMLVQYGDSSRFVVRPHQSAFRGSGGNL